MACKNFSVMTCMSLLAGGFMPKSTLVRMPHTRLCYQRKTLIINAKRGGEISHGGGGKINKGGKPKDTANDANEKLPLGGFNNEKENKKKGEEKVGDKSEEKVDDKTTVNNRATG
ncbi:PREDICTED: uncharacterized protein LOC105109680 [Populus euphratica]|uniref:Uncharacterized protein LOC105109680 n=1 Tax=Populus euphratica TaxID=75702 RepID=A0AAJ6X2A2_POPEU|nr:PREDICTED: uncharacterized protein LOC105109680 [Populus euphratica]